MSLKRELFMPLLIPNRQIWGPVLFPQRLMSVELTGFRIRNEQDFPE